MDNIKQAFLKVKEDIYTLETQISEIKYDMLKLTHELSVLASFIQESLSKLQQTSTQTNQQTDTTPTSFRAITPAPTNQHIKPTHVQENPTQNQNPTHNPTDNLPLKPLKNQYIDISTGNEGVPTDKPTNQQTNQHIEKVRLEQTFLSQNGIQKASEILASLDSIKKEIRLKFKRLTKQELIVFSHIYQLDEEGIKTDYPIISSKMGISESSVRDYVQRLISKEIPVIKEKLNNKKILLHISPELKQIASLDTILKLRQL